MAGRMGIRSCMYFFSLSLSTTMMVMWLPHFFIYSKASFIIIKYKYCHCFVDMSTCFRKRGFCVPSCWVQSVWAQTLLLHPSTPGGHLYTPRPFQRRPLSPGSQRSNLYFLQSTNRKIVHRTSWTSKFDPVASYDSQTLLPSTGIKLIPKPEAEFLVMWQSLGGLQLSPLCALARSRRSRPWDMACSYSSSSNTSKHNWCPLSVNFLVTLVMKSKKCGSS